MSRATSIRAGSADATTTLPRSLKVYFQRSELPLTSLAFVLPFVVFYELGTRYLAHDPLAHGEQRIIAFSLLQQFFGLFGVTGRFLPALAVVGILLSWHIARRDSWHVDVRHLLGMLLESVVVAVPLVALGFVVARYMPLAAAAAQLRGLVVLSIGAGIYEELVFRLMAFACLSFLLIDLLEIRQRVGQLLIVVISALAFSLYHYLGPEVFTLRSATFRTAAGLYFGAVFVCRGFGVTAGAHSAYDIIVVALRTIG